MSSQIRRRKIYTFCHLATIVLGRLFTIEPKYTYTNFRYGCCPCDYHCLVRGWSGAAKVSYIFRHRGVQLRLAYSWTGPAILVAGKDRGGMFLFLLFHSCVPLSSLSLSFIFSTISSISFLPFSGRRHKMSHKGSHKSCLPCRKCWPNLKMFYLFKTPIKFLINGTCLTSTTYWAYSTDHKLMEYFFIIFPQNRIWHFMQIGSIRDNFHKMIKPVFRENWKYFKMLLNVGLRGSKLYRHVFVIGQVFLHFIVLRKPLWYSKISSLTTFYFIFRLKFHPVVNLADFGHVTREEASFWGSALRKIKKWKIVHRQQRNAEKLLISSQPVQSR